MSEPRQRPLDHIAKAPQPGAVRVVLRPGELSRHPTLLGLEYVDLPAVGPVPKVGVRSRAWTPARPGHRRDRIQQLDGLFAVGDVGGGGGQGQGQAVGVGDQMAFAAVLPAVRGVRPRMRPPKTARNEALSTTARERLIWSCFPKWRRTLRQSRGQTSASVQWRNRRQQVGPLGANSAGIWFQPQPVYKTKRIPTRQARSSAGGRPPFGQGGLSGSKGWISFQSASVTHSRAIGLPPVFRPMALLSSLTPMRLQGF